MEKEKVIELIAGRIMDERRKHPLLEWDKIAAAKIYSQWIEYFKGTNKWVSVKDELPFNQTPHVLVAQKGLNHPTRGYFSNGNWIVFYHSGAELCEEERPVTHWMQLPDAPISTTEA